TVSRASLRSAGCGCSTGFSTIGGFTRLLATGGTGTLGLEVAGGAGCGAADGDRGRLSSRRRNNPSLCSIPVLLSGEEIQPETRKQTLCLRSVTRKISEMGRQDYDRASCCGDAMRQSA